MSTFDGYVKDFPDIRIDFFRFRPSHPPPLACFLSHVHSDHLQGLESFRSPFIYCSTATRELLLRLEKYPHRVNLAKGLLETRIVHYRHLKNLLRPLPLNVPTTIELAPRKELRVTLLDANHCPGAVMFLIESNACAILYTGDIRSEPWWVNSLVRNPVMIPYAAGLRRLDKIYLDTTFATKSNIYREFPTKQEGIVELLEKVSQYPVDTVFHFSSWTFGYEDVWLALCAALKSYMHVDEYKMKLYKALLNPRDGNSVPEASALCGFKLGNAHHPGILTSDPEVQLHACEHGHGCNVTRVRPTVRIVPIVNRLTSGEEILELGAGGSQGDLARLHELDVSDQNAAMKLLRMCASIEDVDERQRAMQLVMRGMQSSSKRLIVNHADVLGLEGGFVLDKLIGILRGMDDSASTKVSSIDIKNVDCLVSETKTAAGCLEPLPLEIRFPYARHSSYSELCHLVGALKPRAVHPCTVDEAKWEPNLSVKSLFGHLCYGDVFEHDRGMHKVYLERIARLTSQTKEENQPTQDSSLIGLSQQRETSIDMPTASASSSQELRRDGIQRQSRSQQAQTPYQSVKKRRIEQELESINRVPKIHVSKQSLRNTDFALSSLATSSSQSYYTPKQIKENGAAVNAQGQKDVDLGSPPTISDAAFDSQGSSVNIRDYAKVARRREAYLAATDRQGLEWSAFSILKSSDLNRNQEELR